MSNYTLVRRSNIRLLRMLRFKVRGLGFTIEERTKMQYDNAREAELETRITPADLLDELRHIANEPNCATDVIKVLEEEKLLHHVLAGFDGREAESRGTAEIAKSPAIWSRSGSTFMWRAWACSCTSSPEKMPAKDRAAFTKNMGLSRREVEQWQKLEAKSKKLEKDLKSAKLQKPSKVYQLLSAVPGDQILFLLAHSSERLVHDRIKNYLAKYLPTAQEVTDKDVLATGVKAGTPKFQKAREELILTRLDARPKKIPPPEETPAPGQPGGHAPGPAMARKSM